MTKFLGDVSDRPVQESSTPHCAITIVADVSASMAGEKINDLNTAVNDMIEQLKYDARLRYIIDIAIFAFGEQNREPVCQGFTAVVDCGQVSLKAEDSSTYIADTLNTTIDRLMDRVDLYNKGGGAYKSWLIVISDGFFHDSDYILEETGSRIKQLENQGKLHFFGLGVEGFDANQLKKFAVDPKRVIPVKSANFGEFFSWVGRSMVSISHAQVGEAVTLEPLVFTL